MFETLLPRSCLIEPPRPDTAPSDGISQATIEAELGNLPDLEMLRLIGRGTMASVFLAREPSLKRLVAVKVLAPELSADDTARRRFEREAGAAARISHPHIVTIYRVGRLPNAVPFLVMEYVDGRDLHDVLRSDGPLEPAEAKRIVGEIAAALAAAHRERVIHRDVKPANILVERETRRSVLGDFGIAAIQESGGDAVTKLTREGERLGDPRYMSPEQLLGEPLTEHSDVYSLGIIGYELLTLRSPYRERAAADPADAHLRQPPRDLRAMREDVSPELAELFMRCLAKKPQHRPSAADLARWLGSSESAAGSGLTPGSDSPIGARHRGPIATFFAELRRRKVYRVAAGYAAAGFVILEGADLILPGLPLPQWIYTVLVVTILGGFPIAVVLAWIFDLAQGRLVRTPDVDQRRAEPSVSRAVLKVLGLVVSVALAVLLGWWLLAR